VHCEGDEIPTNYTEDGVLATDRCTAPAQWMNIVPNTVCKDQPHLWTTGLSQDATKAAAGCGGAWAWSEYAYMLDSQGIQDQINQAVVTQIWSSDGQI